MTPRPAVALTLALALGVVLMGLLLTPVAAHTGLESSQPADGETVSEPVPTISLTFNRPVEPTGSGLAVFDGHGVEHRPDSLSSADGQTWRLEFETPLAGGEYEVWWRVVAEDGHIVEGTFRFTVDAPHAASSAEPPPDSAGASATESGGAATAADVDGESPEGASGTGTAQPRSTAPETTLQAGSGLSPAAPTSSSATSDTTAPAAAGTVAGSGPPRRSAGATGVERLAETARVLGLLATLGIVGGLAFVSFVVRDTPSERARVRRVLPICGIVLVVAAVTAALAQAVALEDDWAAIVSLDAITDALSAPFGIAVGLRLLGGFAVLGAARPDMPRTGVRGLAAVSLIGAALVIVSYSFDGHTVTEGPKWLHAAASATHVYAAGVWAGGTMLLADLLRRHRSGTGMILPLIRFSQMAAMSLVLAGVAGTVMAVLVMNRFADLWSTGWGRLLLVKVAFVSFAAFLGARNRWVHMPAVAQHSDQHAHSHELRRLSKTVGIEAAALVCVGIVTAFLVGASTL